MDSGPKEAEWLETRWERGFCPAMSFLFITFCTIVLQRQTLKGALARK